VIRNIGIYSGTFDPIHIGHTAFANEAMRELELDAIILLPEAQPRGKLHVTDIYHRVELIKRAIRGNTKLQVLTLPSKQFTVAQTLAELRSHFKDAHFTFLIGSDVVYTFTYRWDSLEVLLKEATFAVGLRSGDSQDRLETIFKKLESQYKLSILRRYIITKNTHITSSQFRQGKIDTTHLPHPAMASYIQENRLYTNLI